MASGSCPCCTRAGTPRKPAFPLRVGGVWFVDLYVPPWTKVADAWLRAWHRAATPLRRSRGLCRRRRRLCVLLRRWLLSLLDARKPRVLSGWHGVLPPLRRARTSRCTTARLRPWRKWCGAGAGRRTWARSFVDGVQCGDREGYAAGPPAICAAG